MSVFPLHLGFMLAACVAMVAAMLVARFCKARAWWLKVHRALNLASVTFLAIGLAMAVALVGTEGTHAVGFPHRLLGFLSIAIGLAMVALGFSIFRLKGRGADVIAGRKRLHRWLGRVEIVLIITTTVAGFVTAGWIGY